MGPFRFPSFSGGYSLTMADGSDHTVSDNKLTHMLAFHNIVGTFSGRLLIPSPIC